jgi:AraC-like DNA-binding protein
MVRNMRGASITGYAEVATDCGLDPGAMLRSVDIDPRVLSQTDLRIPAESVVELLERSAAASGCETFGLRMALRRQLSDYGPMGLLLAHQGSLREALLTTIRYQQMLNEALLLHVEDGEDEVVTVREEIVTSVAGPQRQAYELAVGTLFRVYGGPVGPRLRARSVHFSHGPPADDALHRQIFGPGVLFHSAFNGFTCRRADFDAPNPLGSAALAGHAESFIRTLPYADHGSLTTEVQKAVHVLLPLNGATVTTVAARLGLSERTLQRRLAEEGADFSGLLNEIRRDYALRYLANLRIPLSQVAGLVGYGRETSFARWFAGEFGMTPSVWRTSAR